MLRKVRNSRNKNIVIACFAWRRKKDKRVYADKIILRLDYSDLKSLNKI